MQGNGGAGGGVLGGGVGGGGGTEQLFSNGNERNRHHFPHGFSMQTGGKVKFITPS